MLTKEQLFTFQHILEQRKDEIKQQLENNDNLNLERSHREAIGELSLYDNHPADTATELYEREKDLALREHYKKEYEEIERALAKIYEGAYGICEVCQKEIPLERLEAIPTTTFCIEHSPEKTVSRDRPAEEEILAPPFEKFTNDGSENTFFDAEDSWQKVEIFGSSESPSDFADPEMIDFNDMLIGEDEAISFVEDIESFIGTDIHGKNVKIYPNALHEKYEDQLDEDDSMSVTGNLGAEPLIFDED